MALRFGTVVVSLAFFCETSFAQWFNPFHYDTEKNACFNETGEAGHLSGYLLECGEIKNQDLTLARVWWPSPPNLKGAILSGSNLTSSFLEEADFTGADLSGVNFTNANLKRSKFKKTLLKGANWKGAFLWEADLSNENLTEADFRDARVKRTNFAGADLSGADFSSNSLNQASFKGTNLSRVKLTNTFLGSADLSQANLDHADLRGAILFGADLTGATTDGADFTGVKYDNNTILPFDPIDAQDRGLQLYADGSSTRAMKREILGNSDGTCSPTTLHLTANTPAEIVLKGDSGMFMFKAPAFQLDLMSMPGQPAKATFTPKKVGTFPFTCGSDSGSPQTKGTLMVM